jgi:hypothetical protein
MRSAGSQPVAPDPAHRPQRAETGDDGETYWPEERGAQPRPLLAGGRGVAPRRESPRSFCFSRSTSPQMGGRAASSLPAQSGAGEKGSHRERRPARQALATGQPAAHQRHHQVRGDDEDPRGVA